MPRQNNSHRNRARTLRKNPTKAERILWTHLRKRRTHGYRFRRQHPIQSFITDFACPQIRLVIEIDGSQHDSDRISDEIRTLKLADAGYQVIRFWNTDVLHDLETVLDTISNAVETRHKRYQ